MTYFKRLFIGAGLCMVTLAAAAQDGTTGRAWDGLVEVKPKRFDAAFLLPGADFRPYKKLMLDPATVAFRKDWMKRVNTATRLSERITQEDAEQIAATARDNFTEVFTETFQKAGYEIVNSPAADVLRARARGRSLHCGARYAEQRRIAWPGARPARDAQQREPQGHQPGDESQRFPRAFPEVGRHQRQGTRQSAQAFAGSGRPPTGPKTRALIEGLPRRPIVAASD